MLTKQYRHRYFVIAFVHTSDSTRLKRVYRNALRSLGHHFSSYFLTLSNPHEMKGDETLPFMKDYILSELLKKTDMKIAYMLVDNWKIDQRFRDVPSRSFNYLIKLIMDNFPMARSDVEHLVLKIDNRNSALRSLNSLEDYLYSELVLGKGSVKKISVEYLESKSNFCIRVADLVASTVYLHYRYQTIGFPEYRLLTPGSNLVYPETNEYLYKLIRPRIVLPFTFPPYLKYPEVAATLELTIGNDGRAQQSGTRSVDNTER